MNIYTAQQARNIAQFDTPNGRQIMQDIKTAASEGREYTFTSDKVTEGQIAALRDLGYKVFNRGNGSFNVER